MKFSTTLPLVIFWIVLVADCMLMLNGLQEYRLYTKTLLVPMLMMSIFAASKDTRHKRSKVLVMLAYFFCFAGDFLLLFDSDPSYFIWGLGAFLTAHLFFIAFFFRLKPFSDKYRLYIFTAGVIVLFYIFILLFLVWNNVSVQSLEIPVVAYAIVLAFMLLTALHTYNNRSLRRLAKNYFIPGAVLFVFSDSALALNKFSFRFEYAGIITMVTYAVAIFMLCIGISRFLSK